MNYQQFIYLFTPWALTHPYLPDQLTINISIKTKGNENDDIGIVVNQDNLNITNGSVENKNYNVGIIVNQGGQNGTKDSAENKNNSIGIIVNQGISIGGDHGNETSESGSDRWWRQKIESRNASSSNYVYNETFTHILKAENRVIPHEQLQKHLQQQWHGPFFFVQAADTQFGMMDTFGTDGSDGKEYPFANWEREKLLSKKTVDAINAMSPKPRFFIVCGDLIDIFPHEFPELRAQQILDLKSIYSNLDPEIPMVCVCGNHDIGNSPTQQTIKQYQNEFGDDYFSFWHGGVAFMVLNSQFYEDPSHVKDLYVNHEAWMAVTLAEAKAAGCKHLVVFQHIPWFVEDVHEAKFDFNIFPEIRKNKLNQLHKAGVTKIFCGHYHQNAGGWYPSEDNRQMEVVVTSAIGCQLGHDEHGMRIVHVTEREIIHQYLSIESLLERISKIAIGPHVTITTLKKKQKNAFKAKKLNSPTLKNISKNFV